MNEQIIIAQMNFITLGQVDIWFQTSADAIHVTGPKDEYIQISRQPLAIANQQA